MIVIEGDGTVLRCSGCLAKYEVTAGVDAAVPRKGFQEYHALCALAPDVASARAVIRDRRKRAFYAQSRHRAKHFMASATQGGSAEGQRR